MDQQFISVILPTYNEKDNVIVLIDAIHRQLKDQPHEVIVVDDQSPDGTYTALAQLPDQRVKAILRTADQGLASSIREGLKHANGNVILIMDSDFDHDPQYIPLMVQSLSRYDCVCASRFLPGGRMNGWGHSLASWLFNMFIRLRTGSSLSDHLYGFFIIKREVLEQCPYDKIFFGYGEYYIRLLHYLEKNKVSILEVPAVNGGRVRKNKMSLLEIFRQYFLSVIRLSTAAPAKNYV